MAKIKRTFDHNASVKPNMAPYFSSLRPYSIEETWDSWGERTRKKVSFSWSPAFAESVVRLLCGFVLLPLQCEKWKSVQVSKEEAPQGWRACQTFPFHAVRVAGLVTWEGLIFQPQTDFVKVYYRPEVKKLQVNTMAGFICSIWVQPDLVSLRSVWST